ncbi:MAG: hypothetical protein JO090_01875 [Rhizobacter sp.]|nr:hypothetical protein [Rhizobacter sp.]
MAEIASAAGQTDIATGYRASADAASERLKNIESLLHEAAELVAPASNRDAPDPQPRVR